MPYTWGGVVGEGGNSHVKRTGVLVILLGVKKVVLVSLRVSSLMSFFGTFYGIELKKYDR